MTLGVGGGTPCAALYSAVHLARLEGKVLVQGAQVGADGRLDDVCRRTGARIPAVFKGHDHVGLAQRVLAGRSGTVLRTFDAGQSFTVLSDSSLGTLVKVRFLSADVGWVAGHNGVFVTSDGGAGWHCQLGSVTCLDAHFVDPMTIYMITGSNTSPFPGYIYTTTDAGLTWQMQFLQNGVLWSGGVHFEDANTGWVVSGGGTILHTTNGGGVNWTGITEIQSKPFKGIQKGTTGEIHAMPTSIGIRLLIENVQPAELRLQVYDPLGRLVWANNKRPERKGNFSFYWPCTKTAKGLYFARALQGNQGWNGRILLLR